MSSLSTIVTNNALKKAAQLGISEATIMDVFNNGQTEKSAIGGWNAIKKYSGYEIGVYYNRKPSGEWIIISVWKRERR